MLHIGQHAALMLCLDELHNVGGNSAMLLTLVPIVGGRYSTQYGEYVEVIGFGTGGVVVEYRDGSAKLVDPQTWQSSYSEIETTPGAHKHRQIQ
jgi:hypothetical protein